jgi:hypothetical protein
MRHLIRCFLTCALAIVLPVSAFTGCKRIAGLMGVHDPVTAASAPPEIVPFLKLPSSASNVGYWDSGHDQVATFNISEDALLSCFPDRKFTPITVEVFYNTWTFGDVHNWPQKSYKMQTTTTGLIHEERWENGGFRRIVYDRNLQLCSYEFVRW